MKTDRLFSAWESMRNKEIERLNAVNVGWNGFNEYSKVIRNSIVELDARVERIANLSAIHTSHSASPPPAHSQNPCIGCENHYEGSLACIGCEQRRNRPPPPANEAQQQSPCDNPLIGGQYHDCKAWAKAQNNLPCKKCTKKQQSCDHSKLADGATCRKCGWASGEKEQAKTCNDCLHAIQFDGSVIGDHGNCKKCRGFQNWQPRPSAQKKGEG